MKIWLEIQRSTGIDRRQVTPNGKHDVQRLEDLARLTNPVVRGWMNYYGRYYRSKCIQVLAHLIKALAAWVRWKCKRFRRRERASMHWLGQVAQRDKARFVLWQLGVVPATGE